MKQSEYLEGKDFSLVLGGPFFQLLSKVHLTGKTLELLKLRVVLLSMIAWLPLLLLSIANGQAWGNNLSLPFIKDFDVHIRFLLTLPLFIIAELVVHQRMLVVVNQFRIRELIPEPAVVQFQKAISSALRLRNAVIAEVLMLVIIYVIGYKFIWHESIALDTPTWYSESAVGKGQLSWAGIWFRYISLPLFQFLFLRWYYRIFIWARFLFQVSRIELRLVPSHPDHVGGLGFLTNSIYAFMPLALAHGAMLAGMLSNHIFYEGAKLLDFKVVIIIIVVIVMCLAILPLFSFSSQLADVKRIGSLHYGKLACHYVQQFENRYIKGTPVDNATISNEIQSLADLSNSYKIVEGMQFVPVTKSMIIMLVVITLVPVFPLVLTMMPLSDLIKMLAGVLF